MNRKPRDNNNSVNSEERKQYLRDYYQKNKERMRAQIYESIKEQRKTEAYKQKMKEKHLDALLARALVRLDAV